MGVRIIGVPGTPPGGQIGLIIPAPPLDGGCTCKDVTLHWAVPDDDDSSSTASTTSCPAVFSADGTICPSTEWSFDVTWDGDSGHVPTIVQIGAAAWKVIATAAGTFTVTASMQCGGVAVAMPKLTDVIGTDSGGGGGDWANLKDIATVTANPGEVAEGCSYDASTGIFTCARGDPDDPISDYNHFRIEVSDENLPVCCRIVPLTGSLFDPADSNFDFCEYDNSDSSRSINLQPNSPNFNENFSIHVGDSPSLFVLRFVNLGLYTETTFRIEYMPTDPL
jgi:hypothetical protein